VRFGGLEFTVNEGDWTQADDSLQQSRIVGVTRCYTKTGRNFEIAVSIKIEETKTGEDGRPVGEAKIIFSEADKGEAYRLDFMLGLNVCRLTLANSLAFMLPFRVPLNEDFNSLVTVRNNFLTVQVNGMTLLSSFQFGTSSDGVIGFGTWVARASFSKLRIRELIRKTCFVVMPFDEKRNFVYEYVIKPALEQHPVFDFEVTRADKVLTSERITQEISAGIEKADLLIVDISKENMNVYYELGYGHAKDRKAILIRESIPEIPPIPFDIKDFRYHPYEFSPEGFRSMKEKLTELITNVVQKP
jgi:hypothetical protein